MKEWTEEEWKKAARDLGCIVCRLYYDAHTFPSLHHIRKYGAGADDLQTIPLCPIHHQHGPMAIHVNSRAFRKRFGDEDFLLKAARTLIEREEELQISWLNPKRTNTDKTALPGKEPGGIET
jgi:hypothetical protein